MSRRRYDNSRRRAQAEQTREGIVRAAIDIVRSSGADGLSFADVASRAGVATRTVYRHFPTPDDLLRTAADLTISDFRPPGRTADDRRTPASVAAFYRRVHAFLGEDRANYELLFRVPTRDQGNVEQMLSQAFGPELDRIPEAQRTAANGLLELLLSPFAWEILGHCWGIPPEHVTRACLAGVQVLLERLADEPELLDPDAPMPSLFADPLAPEE